MKNKYTIIWLTALMISFCFLTVSSVEADAQTRKKRIVKKTTSQRKTTVKKTANRNNRIPPRQGVTFVIGKTNAGNDPIVSATSQKSVDAKNISLGVINGKAASLIIPAYPPAARAVHASGAVNVQVIIDEAGNVISANAVSGHPLLRQSAEQAARESKFTPTLLSGQPVKVTGIVIYNFAAQ